jgi:hypothetical protein
MMKSLSNLARSRIASENTVAGACNVLCSLAACVVLVAGILRLESLELSEAQVHIGSIAVVALSGIFLIMGSIFKLWQGQLECARKSGIHRLE